MTDYFQHARRHLPGGSDELPAQAFQNALPCAFYRLGAIEPANTGPYIDSNMGLFVGFDKLKTNAPDTYFLTADPGYPTGNPWSPYRAAIPPGFYGWECQAAFGADPLVLVPAFGYPTDLISIVLAPNTGTTLDDPFSDSSAFDVRGGSAGIWMTWLVTNGYINVDVPAQFQMSLAVNNVDGPTYLEIATLRFVRLCDPLTNHDDNITP